MEKKRIRKKEKEKELGGAWIQKKNIGKKKGKRARWSLDTEEKYWEKVVKKCIIIFKSTWLGLQSKIR